MWSDITFDFSDADPEGVRAAAMGLLEAGSAAPAAVLEASTVARSRSWTQLPFQSALI